MDYVYHLIPLCVQKLLLLYQKSVLIHEIFVNPSYILLKQRILILSFSFLEDINLCRNPDSDPKKLEFNLIILVFFKNILCFHQFCPCQKAILIDMFHILSSTKSWERKKKKNLEDLFLGLNLVRDQKAREIFLQKKKNRESGRAKTGQNKI